MRDVRRPRILFVTSNRLGDAVLSTGLLDHLIRVHPDARITVACGPVAEGIFARMPNRERVVVLAKQRYAWHWLGLWRAVAATRWDLAVDIRGSALTWLIPTRRRAIARPAADDGTRHKTVQLARVLGLETPPMPVVWFDAADCAHARSLLPAGRPVIALAPTANWTPKIWPAERFAALFRRLAAAGAPDAVPAVIAGPGAAEAAMARPLLAALPDAIDLRGRLTLAEIGAFLTEARLFAGNDSGLMHLAAASGVPTLGLFGPTNAVEYGPAGRWTAVVVGQHGRMDTITVEQAAKAAERLLAEQVHPFANSLSIRS